MDKDKLAEVLALHAKWACSETDGVRANLAGANLARANLAGANLARAYLARAYLADANLARAYLADANLADANLARANLAGATLREGLKAGRYVGACSRGDSYVFYAFETDAGELIYFAGCRAFLRSEYEKHIEAEYPGTPKAAATRACLNYLANLKQF